MYHPRSVLIVMVHYYYYVSAGAQCDESTRIYKVAVGTSKQCQRDYAFLVAHALQHGHYFEVVSSRSDEFVKRLRHSLAQFNVLLEWLSCRDLCRELRQVTATPCAAGSLAVAHQQRKSLNLSYRISSNLSRRAAKERR